ncbi:hypothetical protein Pmani_013200 [Petrolisthes manimaculis]|uniref:Uncharacterized protein n=1 Tax=Petrolisthes manimaculis TaxID=1843537 RepID=A0AAE1UEB3_9EUCA|nr:hypothetical protein Pmani_013200 [Petrolisthes manimaculis]
MTNTSSKLCSSELWVSSERKVNTQCEVSPDDAAQQLLQNVSVDVRGGRRVPILRPRSEIEEDCKEIKPLGRGYFGLVTLVRYCGMIAVKKTPCPTNATHLIDFGVSMMVDQKPQGNESAEDLLYKVASPAVDISYLASIFYLIANPLDGRDCNSLADVWNEGLKELVCAMKNTHKMEKPSITFVYQELNRLLKFTTNQRMRYKEFMCHLHKTRWGLSLQHPPRQQWMSNRIKHCQRRTRPKHVHYFDSLTSR